MSTLMNEGGDFKGMERHYISPGSRLEKAARRIENFEEKLSNFEALLCNEAGHSKAKKQELLAEAEVTSDFPVLFGTVLERQLRSKYNLMAGQVDWRQYVKVGTQNDFRNAWDMALYGNRQTLPVVKERGEYKTQSNLSDGKFVIAVQKYGRTFGLSWEAIINDDLGAFSDIADDLALSASLSESKYATGLFAGSGGANSTLFSASGTHPIDGTSFNNLGTLDLTGANIASTITAMKSQKDYDGNPISFGRFHLVVPVALEYTAKQALSQNLLIASALGSTSQAATTTSENVIAKYPITVHVNPWLDQSGYSHATLQWYMFGDPADGDAIRVNFLRGHEAPEVTQKMSDKITLGGAPVSPLEGDFDSDSILWRVRHVFGGIQTDPRFAYAQNPTS